MEWSMNTVDFVSQLKKKNIEFYTGVPDSVLKPFCDYLEYKHGKSNSHIIAANEGNAVSVAAGYYLATGNTPCVYMQNSGLGNAINPIVSLLSSKVYSIPCVFIIGWRGEPGKEDEPQHAFQGEITLKLLETLDIKYVTIDGNTTVDYFKLKLDELEEDIKAGKSIALVVKKGALNSEEVIKYENKNQLLREDVIRSIVDLSKDDIIISTTGKASRELFEVREDKKQLHHHDFLTVGSMGHSSSIALGIALNKPNTNVWCIDGDGAMLMHMGSLAVIGDKSPENFIHVVINNEAHESVGGQSTPAKKSNFSQIALACGYKSSYTITKINELEERLKKIRNNKGPIFVEIKCKIKSRNDLGRPTISPIENKLAFMKFIEGCD